MTLSWGWSPGALEPSPMVAMPPLPVLHLAGLSASEMSGPSQNQGVREAPGNKTIIVVWFPPPPFKNSSVSH